MGHVPDGFHANDGSLISATFIRADKTDGYMAPGTASADLHQAFRLLDLPIPHDGEYFEGKNADRAYLNTHGLVLSVVRKEEEGFLAQIRNKVFGRKGTVFDACEIVRPDILQPIYSMPLGNQGNCRLEIIPGVKRVGVINRDEAREMAGRLKKAGIQFDPTPEFVGVLHTPGSDEQQKLIVNRRSIRPMGEGIETQASAGLQDKIFGPLAEEFAAAMRAGSAAQVKRVMNECAQIASLQQDDPARILNRHWMAATQPTSQEIGLRFSKIRNAATAYEASVAEHLRLAA